MYNYDAEISAEADRRPVTPTAPASVSSVLVNPALSRYRTVLSDYQLRVLRSCYAATTRPDTATRDRLVHMTGLSGRVIRVWFQNRRCKDKKRCCNNNDQRPASLTSSTVIKVWTDQTMISQYITSIEWRSRTPSSRFVSQKIKNLSEKLIDLVLPDVRF